MLQYVLQVLSYLTQTQFVLMQAVQNAVHHCYVPRTKRFSTTPAQPALLGKLMVLATTPWVKTLPATVREELLNFLNSMTVVIKFVLVESHALNL